MGNKQIKAQIGKDIAGYPSTLEISDGKKKLSIQMDKNGVIKADGDTTLLQYALLVYPYELNETPVAIENSGTRIQQYNTATNGNSTIYTLQQGNRLYLQSMFLSAAASGAGTARITISEKANETILLLLEFAQAGQFAVTLPFPHWLKVENSKNWNTFFRLYSSNGNVVAHGGVTGYITPL